MVDGGRRTARQTPLGFRLNWRPRRGYLAGDRRVGAGDAIPAGSRPVPHPCGPTGQAPGGRATQRCSRRCVAACPPVACEGEA